MSRWGSQQGSGGTIPAAGVQDSLASSAVVAPSANAVNAGLAAKQSAIDTLTATVSGKAAQSTVTQLQADLTALAAVVASLGGGGDTTAPTIGTPHVEDAAKSVVVFPITEPNSPALNGTSAGVTLSGAAASGKTVSGVAVVGSNLNVTLSAPLAYGDVLNVALASGMVKDASNNLSAAKSATAVTNNIAGGGLPADNPGASGAASIVVTGDALTLDYQGGSLTGQKLRLEYTAAGGADGTFPFWKYFADATAGTFTISGLAAGDYFVRAVALDSSNNEGNASQSWKETAA